MKKFLSLVLALVMTMSLVTIGAGAADFSDDGDINYAEAIDVMSALKVVGGYSDGSFRPDAVLTRGAAAKIICNMLMGTTAADALAVSSAPFSDVPADSTFAGYIAYMVKEGIVSGYSDGTFRPGANLTGYAFMKMLLTALGYDAKKEGYTGANWSVAVAKRALNIGLDDDLLDTFNGLKPVTRQEACLYAFNTLQADLVFYPNSSTITAGDVTISTQNSATVVSEKTEAYNAKDGKGITDEDGDTPITQFAERYFRKLTKVKSQTDDFGRPGTKWELDGDKIGTYVDDAKFTYVGETKAAALAKDLKDYKINGVDKSTYKVTEDTTKNPYKIPGAYYVDHDTATDLNVKKGESVASTLAGLTSVNTVIEVYTGKNKKIDAICLIKFGIGKVDSITTNTKGDVTYVIKHKGGENFVEAKGGSFKDYNPDSSIDDTIKVTGAVKEGDFVIYTMGKSASGTEYTLYAMAAETVKGTLTRKGDKTVTLSGTSYDAWKDVTGDAGKDGTAYLDLYGNVAYWDGATESDVVYVAGKWAENSKGVYTYYLQLVHTDGTVEEYKLGTNQNAKDQYDAAKQDVYTISNGSNGPELKSHSNGSDNKANIQKDFTGSKISKDDKKIGTSKYYVADDVTFIYVKDSGNDIKVSTVKGMHNIYNVGSASTTGAKAVYEVWNDATPMETKFVFVPNKAAANNGDNVVFVGKIDNQGTVTNKKGDKVNEQLVYINGEKTYIPIATSDVVNISGFYTYSIDEATGQYSLHNEVEFTAYQYGVNYDTYHKTNKEVLETERYITMYTLAGDNNVKGFVKGLDTQGAKVYDISGNDFASVSALYKALKADKEKLLDDLSIFAICEKAPKTGVNVETIYIMKTSDLLSTKYGPATNDGYKRVETLRISAS